MRPFITAISGTSGGGKTTLADNTAALLERAMCLYFDDYLAVTNDPVDIRGWLNAGAKPDEFKTPRLASDLQKLAAGESIRPADGGLAEHVLVEDPFGRSRAETAPFVDFVAYLDLPPDIALARRVIRAIKERRREPEALLAHIHGDLMTYLMAGREAYTAASRAARESADLILDGTRPAQELAAELAAAIRQRRS
jgi:uridine kinase